MQKELKYVSDLVLFARIVQAGGISKCATDLGMERTTISRRLKMLEESLGTQLLIRSPKQTTPTEAGRRCFERCVRLLEIVNSMGQVAVNDSATMSGTSIIVGAPPDVVDGYLEAKLAQFERDNDAVNISRHLISGGSALDLSVVDLLVTWETDAYVDGLVRKLASVRQSVYASPECASQHNHPSEPSALRKVPCIIEGAASNSHVWNFSRDAMTRQVQVRCNFVAPNVLEAREAAIAGFGCCQLPDYLGEPFVRYGRLVKLIGGYQTNDRYLITATAKSRTLQPRIASLRLFLEAAFDARQDANLETAPSEGLSVQPQSTQ